MDLSFKQIEQKEQYCHVKTFILICVNTFKILTIHCFCYTCKYIYFKNIEGHFSPSFKYRCNIYLCLFAQRGYVVMLI